MEIIRNLNFYRIIMSTDFWVNITIVFVATLVLYWVISQTLALVGRRVQKWSTTQHSGLYLVAVNMLANTKRILVLFISLLISLRFVELPATWQSALDHAWFLVLTIQIALWIDSAIHTWSKRMTGHPSAMRNTVTLVILGVMARLLVWTLMFLSILGNMGVNITALVASLGVGGIAIALAVQAVLSDVLASLSIGFDKPFVIGDFVVFKDISGTIEHIGLKTTRIRSLSGEQVVCSNAILLQQTIHNYKRMQTRRIVFSFGLAYSTPPEKLRLVGGIVKDIIDSMEDANYDRAHFLSFDDFKLTFEVVYIVQSADYNKYMDIQQEVNISLMEKLEAQGIKLAIPVQQVYVQNEGNDFPEPPREANLYHANSMRQ